MAVIKKIDEHTIYQNPMPHLQSRCAKFPGLTELPTGELIALFEIGEALESVDSVTYLSRSEDLGKTWKLQGELYNQADAGLDFPYSEGLKPTLLQDGSLIAVGCRIFRNNPNLPVGNPETGGLLPGENVISFSHDEGKTWSIPKAIEHVHPEILELSGPCVQISSGDIVAVGPPFRMWDGSNPTGQSGILLRSSDNGRTWDVSENFFELILNGCQITPWEMRLCEIQPGKLVVIAWMFDIENSRHLPNHIAISHDYGQTWSEPINTNIMGQASNLMWFEEDKLLTIHSHRAEDIGLYVRLVDLKDDKWDVLEEEIIWGNVKGLDTSSDIIDQLATLKFGQPSLIKLKNGEILATHWGVEDCLYKIKTHRLMVKI